MARVAAYLAGVGSEALAVVERGDHLHHLSRGLLLRLVVALPDPVVETRLRVCALLDVAEVAAHAERDGDEVHQREELRTGQTFEHLYVLPSLFDGLVRLRLPRGARHARDAPRKRHC